MRIQSILQHGAILTGLILLLTTLDTYRASGSESAFLPEGIVRDLARTREELSRANEILQACFGGPVDIQDVRTVPVTLTAYSSSVDQCDDTPHITASNRSVRIGIIAVSNDLMEEFGLTFGQRVLIPGHGLFEIQDRMNSRWHRKVDIWHGDREAARLFGKQLGTLIWMAKSEEGGEPELLARQEVRF